MTREEAIKIIESNCSCTDSKLREACAMFIPELKESEDEKIRKSLLAYIKGESKRLDTKKWIAYLEKQKDSKVVIFDHDREQPSNEDDGKFVKISVRKEVAEQFQRLGDEIQTGQSSFIGAMNPQEQPGPNLEKELDQWRHKHFNGKRDGDYYSEYLERESELDMARHFYELGLNARKEE